MNNFLREALLGFLSLVTSVVGIGKVKRNFPVVQDVVQFVL